MTTAPVPGTDVPRRRVVLLVLLLGVACLAVAAPVWVSTTGTTALSGSVPVTVTGTEAAPAVSAAALVVMAAGLALGLVGRRGRWLPLAVVGFGGMVIAWSAVDVIRSAATVARSGVAEVTGVSGTTGPVDLSLAPYLAGVLGLAVLGTAVWAAVGPIEWRTRANRYGPTEPAAPRTTPSAGSADLDERDTWDRLSQGEDPT